MSSILRSSKFVRYFFGLARSIISNRQDIDGGLLRRSHNLAGIFSNNQSSNLSTLQSGALLEQTVRQLDEDARRTGRVSMSEIEDALNSIKERRKATASQSLMVIRCCGNLVPEETPEQRTKLVEEIWKTFEKLGVHLDISHYNALLKVYLENEHKFSPTEFLAKLEKNGIEPNRVTYQRLIAGFCQQGDIAGATKILEFMKDKQLPVSEGVFNALILGHSKAEDMESAEGILTMMRQAGVEPSNETYATLLRGHAARGDAEAVRRVLTECKVKDVLLSDRDFLEIGYTAAVNGHDELLDEILKNIRHSMGYNQDAANVIIRLLTVGKDEAAYKVFLSLNPPLRTDGTPNMSGHIFIKHLVKSNKPVDKILSWCDRLKEDGHTPLGLWLAVDASFHHNNTHLTMDLLRALKQKGEPIRPHYFWPSLVTAGKASDFERMKEIMRLMNKEFEVMPNSETLCDYILPYTPSSQGTTELLKIFDSVDVKRGQAIAAIVSHLVSKNKAKEAAELVISYPNLNYKGALNSRKLIDVLEATRDVPSVVCLLQVLSKSQSMSREEEEEESGSGEEIISRFLINLVSYAPTQKYTRDVLKEMLKLGLPISNVCAEIVEGKLQGSQLTSEISELLAELSSGKVVSQPIKRGATSFVKTPESVLRMKERMLANNEPEEKIIGVNRSLHQLYCHEGDIENALKIKQELEEKYNQKPTVGMWASMIDAYCTKNDLEGAKNCLEKIKAISPDVELDGPKILSIARLMVENNQIEDAEELLKSVNRRDKDTKDSVGYITRNLARRLCQSVAETYKDPERVKKMVNLLAELGYLEINNASLGSVVKACLIKDDLEGALKVFEECVKQHRATPFKNELTMKFIEKEDATNLQTIVDLSTEVHGEVNSLYDLVMAFIECGKIRQARKILETPGLNSRTNRLIVACERFKKEGKVDCLEGLVEATKDVPIIDRSEIYNSLLDTYCEAGEAEKALGLWTKMQDEDVNVSDEFLIKLGTFLKEKGLEVPFEIPKKVGSPMVDEEKQKTTNKSVSSPARSRTKSPLIAACIDKDVDKALKIKDEMESGGQRLTRGEASRLLELLVEGGRLDEAVALVAEGAERPIIKNLRYLVARLATAGEVELMQRLRQCLSEDLQKLTSFSNKYMSAAVVAGKAKEELTKLEAEIDKASSSEEVDRVTAQFPFGGIMAVLEASPSHYDQVVQIVEKFHSKGSAGPANTLVMHHVTRGEAERGRELFQRYRLDNSSQLMFRSVLRKAKFTQDARLLEELLAMLEPVPAFTPEAKGLVYSNIIDIYNQQGNYDTALQKLDEAVKTVPLEMIHTRSLYKLKSGLEADNKTFKYTIPEKKQKDSSSSSSSSESEPKKSVASN